MNAGSCHRRCCPALPVHLSDGASPSSPDFWPEVEDSARGGEQGAPGLHGFLEKPTRKQCQRTQGGGGSGGRPQAAYDHTPKRRQRQEDLEVVLPRQLPTRSPPAPLRSKGPWINPSTCSWLPPPARALQQEASCARAPSSGSAPPSARLCLPLPALWGGAKCGFRRKPGIKRKTLTT